MSPVPPIEPALAGRVGEAAAALRRGGVIAYPTETFYGLGALASDDVAVARLVRAKGRPDGKPLPLLGADLAQLQVVARFSPLAIRLAEAFWPGPLTLVLPARAGLPAAIGGDGTVGVRVTSSAVAAALAAAAGGALVATSANPSGEPPPTTAAALDPALVARLDLVLDGGVTPGGAPSTVVAVEEGRITLLRPGAVALEALRAFERRGPSGTGSRS